MGFPPAGAQVYRNEAGEPLGWDIPAEPDYCDEHGITYMGDHCPACLATEDPDYDDESEYEDYGPGDAVDDEGGMSESRHAEW